MSVLYFDKSSKLSELISTLERGERQTLHRQLEKDSPLGKKLFEMLCAAHDSASSSIAKKDLFVQIYPNEPFHDLKFRHLCSDVLRQIEHILISRKDKQEKIKDYLHRMELYLDKNIERGFSRASKQFDKSFNSLEVKNARHFRLAYQAEQLRYQYYLVKAKRIEPENLSKALDFLEKAEVLEKLKLYCALINSKSIVHTEFRQPDIQDLEHRILQNQWNQEALMKLYLGVLETLRKPENETAFYETFKLLNNKAPFLDPEEAHELFVYLLNFCIRKINKEGRFLRESFEIYRAMIDQDLLIRQGFLSPWTLKNIVVNGLRLGEHEWVHQFIENWIDRLPPEARETAFNYNMARYFFHVHEFDRVLELLQQVEYQDIFYSLDTRSLLMKSYYELDEFEAMYHLMDSFRIFLRRKKGLSEKHRQNFSNLIRFTRKASKIIPGDLKKAEALLLELNSTDQIADLNWIQSKISELISA